MNYDKGNRIDCHSVKATADGETQCAALLPQLQEFLMLRKLPRPLGQNSLICTLPGSDRALIEPHLKPVTLTAAEVLEQANTRVNSVYFLISGIGSTVTYGKNGHYAEVGLFGFEGMSGLSVVMHGEQSPQETFMQHAGAGLAIEAGRLRDLMEQSPSLQRHLLRFLQISVTQTAQTSLANARATLEDRLARWLLMCHDRLEGDTMVLTHQFLAIMLGVRRAGVTVGTHALKDKGLIQTTRGQIEILDRAGLEAQARDIYGVPEAEYARLFGPELRNGSPGYGRDEGFVQQPYASGSLPPQ